MKMIFFDKATVDYHKKELQVGVNPMNGESKLDAQASNIKL
jgi:hypothetical protein